MRCAFGECEIDVSCRELLRAGRTVHVEPQVFDLIAYLISHRDRVVGQDELLEAIWNGRIVSESTFRSRINAARQAIGDNGRQQNLIRTMARRGFRFVGRVVDVNGAGRGRSEDRANAGAPPPDRTEQRAEQQGLDSGPGPAGGALTDNVRQIPVVAVLPFADLGGDGQHEYIADGLAEDITTALVRHRNLTVIARNSAFALGRNASDVRLVGQKLGADYVVDGSVRRTKSSIRITCHLVETPTGRLIWADHYDRRTEELFSVQDDIIAMIAACVEPQIGSIELSKAARKPPSSFEAWDLYQLGTNYLFKSTKDGNLEAQRLFRLATEQDGGLARAYAHRAYAIVLSMLYFDVQPTPERLQEALELARTGRDLDEQDAMIRFVLGRALLANRSYGDALAELETAVRLNPTLPLGHCGVGDSLTYEGRYEEAFPHFQRAIELSPYDPQRWAYRAYRAMAHLFARQFRLALDWARRATRIPNCHYWAFSHCVAALGHLDHPDELEAATKALFAQKPDFTIEIARARLFYIKDDAQRDLYLEGLRRAGVPDR